MANPPTPDVFATDRNVGEIRSASGIWSLEAGRLASVEEFADGPAVVLVRSEHVLLLAVPLPPMSGNARRRDALPFAIEDRVCEPLDQLHVALGAELTPGIWLAGVVSHALMREWIAQLDEAGLERAALVPDSLSLPVPGPASWSVDLAGGRAMVRTENGTGFALPQALFGRAWSADGEPACIAYGEPLPPSIAAAQAGLEAQPLADRLLSPALDLRQGIYARSRRPLHPLWKRIAWVAGMGALAHGAIAIADTLALTHIAAQRQAAVRTLASGMQPPVLLGGDLGQALDALTPEQAEAGPDRFIPLLARTVAALSANQTPAGWRSVSFDRLGGSLTVEVEANDISDLQRMAQALTRAGLSAQPGAASTENGRAVGSFVIRAT